MYAGKFPMVANMKEAISLANRHHIKSEIIGEWLYCFTSPIIGYQLEGSGFWYSYKHDAYVYSGNEKNGSPNNGTLDEIRYSLGYWPLLEQL
jgi:hypothetical protein